MSYTIGNYVQTKWVNSPHYGKTGKIVNIGAGGSVQIDFDNDGIGDAWMTPNSLIAGSNINLGALTENVENIVENTESTFDLIIPVILGVLAFSIFITFLKKIKSK